MSFICYSRGKVREFDENKCSKHLYRPSTPKESHASKPSELLLHVSPYPITKLHSDWGIIYNMILFHVAHISCQIVLISVYWHNA